MLGINCRANVGFNWSDTFEILGIYYDMTKFKEITELNILRKMGEIQKLI